MQAYKIEALQMLAASDSETGKYLFKKEQTPYDYNEDMW